MPPSVARSQLPKDLAHATKEPSQDDGITRFLDGCCTNGTEIDSGARDKRLFLLSFLSDADFAGINRAAGQLGALLAPEVDRYRIKPNFHSKFSNSTAMQEDESWKSPSDSCSGPLRFAPDANQITAAAMIGTRNRAEIAFIASRMAKKRRGLAQELQRLQIWRLRPALASGISALLEMWPSG